MPMPSARQRERGPTRSNRCPLPAAAQTGEPLSAASTGRATAEAMASDNAVRGRFDKSEPTIIDGEDLDVPTFMRKNLKVK